MKLHLYINDAFSACHRAHASIEAITRFFPEKGAGFLIKEEITYFTIQTKPDKSYTDAKKLLDFDLASNNGGWQWASSTGCDASPYFRIFNPTTQIQKFDKNLEYIKNWVPDFQELTYPTPIVDHKFARERCLKVYKEALNN